MTTELANALRASRALTKFHGSSYYASTLLFPPAIRNAVFALYGFVRKADEIVDTEEQNPAHARLRLADFQEAWHDAYRTQISSDPILFAAVWVFRTHDIPLVYADDFFTAMRADTKVSRYAAYVDLEAYMYGSAAVVGLMLTKIIGTSDPRTRAHAEVFAKDLGYAMQLTNFLRDIHEDYTQRNRIYLPQEDLERFGVTEEMVTHGLVTPEFKALMQFEIARARALYASADAGIPLLTRSGQKPVRLARVLYSKILDRIEDAKYDVFSERRYTTRMQKIRYAAPILFSL